MVRSAEQASALQQLGIAARVGTLDDRALLQAEARAAQAVINAVINAASSDHAGAVAALIEALQGSGKPFLHTSGSSIVGDASGGEASPAVYDEAHLPAPTPDKAARVAIDQRVRAAAGLRVRSVVLFGTRLDRTGSALAPMRLS